MLISTFKKSEVKTMPENNTEKMTVVMVEPNKKAYLTEIGTELEDLQRAVGGGYIEAIYPFEDNVGLICNEEGKIIQMPLNRALKDEEGNIYDVVAGPFFIAGLTEDNFGSLTEEQAEKYLEMFRVPEHFYCIDNKIVAIPVEEKSENKVISKGVSF